MPTFIKFRPRGITQNKEYNLQNKAKVLNHDSNALPEIRELWVDKCVSYLKRYVVFSLRGRCRLHPHFHPETLVSNGSEVLRTALMKTLSLLGCDALYCGKWLT